MQHCDDDGCPARAGHAVGRGGSDTQDFLGCLDHAIAEYRENERAHTLTKLDHHE